MTPYKKRIIEKLVKAWVANNESEPIMIQAINKTFQTGLQEAKEIIKEVSNA